MACNYKLATVAIAVLLAVVVASGARAALVAPGNDPILIIPGLAASHNSKRILKDQAGGEWDFTPSANVYEPLIQQLENSGYRRGEDIFVVHYDWRQSNRQSAVEYLMPAIDKALEGKWYGEKVNIIAHSMGGLVARSYAQSQNLYRDDINKMILLGTPSSGASDAYVIWEGGLFPQRWGRLQKAWIGRIERSIARTRKAKEMKRPETYRTFFPSIKELLPIHTVVTREGGPVLSSSLTERNYFLEDLRATKSRLEDRDILVITIAGDGLQTLDGLTLSSSRTQEDEELNRWRDGHANPNPPVASETAGDQTVMRSSVELAGYVHDTIDDAVHDELPILAQNAVMDHLVGGTHTDFLPGHIASAAVGVDILSPVLPVVTGPGGEVLSSDTNTFADAYFDWDAGAPDDPKMLTILDPPEGEYSVELTGTGVGEFTAITSYADEDSEEFSELEGQASPDFKKTYTFTVEDGQFTPPVYDAEEEEGEEEPEVKEASSEDPPGEETDCCPGPDPVLSQAEAAEKGKVLGAKTASSKYRHLVPIINKLHREAYGRNPTFEEHIYWWDRVLKGHFQRADQLLGAMQWRARG